MNWPIEYGGVAGQGENLHAASFLLYAAALVVAFLVSLCLTPMVRHLARRAGMIDRPDARRIHTTPTPRGGGLAIFIAFHVALACVSWLCGDEYSPLFTLAWRMRFLAISALLVAIGVADDAFGLKPWLKLASQIFVASLLFFNGLNFSAFFVAHFPYWVNYLITVFWIVGAINAFNLIDGMDGLATRLAFIASVGLAITMFFRGMSLAAIPFLALAGACLGFLRYNFHPATVFLGDAGSMFLGLTLATLPLMTASKQELVASLGVPLMAMGIPIFDTAIAIWRRSVRAALPRVARVGSKRIRVMQGDTDHLHHRVLAKTMNQRRAAVVLYIANVVLVTVGIAAMLFGKRAPGVYLLAFVVAVLVVVRHLTSVELLDTGRALLSRTRTTVSRRLVVPFYVGCDILMLSVAWCGSRLLADLPVTKFAVRTSGPLFVASVFVMLALARMYVRVWSRALLREYALVAMAIVGGVLSAAGLVILTDAGEPGWVRAACMYLLLALVFVVGLRLINETFRETMAMIERMTLLERSDASRLLVCDGGERFRLFLRETRAQVGKNSRVVVGVLDDDINLRGRMVFGYPVLGIIEDLPAVAAHHHIHAVVLAADLPPERHARLAVLARQAGVSLIAWSFIERQIV